MEKDEKDKVDTTESKQRKTVSPLIFISHDSRDAELAEAFSKLLGSVSAGMLKAFRSSDKKGKEGIEFGDEWYKRLMDKLDSASDVVCLFTERSIERPWILYEAGVAKGKLNKPVLGLALGIPLNAVSTGPFFQFQNSDDSVDSLIKLLKQLADRVPLLELDDDVLKGQVKLFKEKTDKILSALNETIDKDEPASDSAAAKILEEMKVMIRDLPGRIEDRVSEGTSPKRRRKLRHFHPMMLDKMMFMSEEENNPIGILIMAGLFRDDMPWLYELAIEAYRTIKSGNISEAETLLNSLGNSEKLIMSGPFREEFIENPEMDMIMHEFPQMLRHLIKRTIARKKETSKGKHKEIH
jgi:hypothetical protein